MNSELIMQALEVMWKGMLSIFYSNHHSDDSCVSDQ